MKPMWHVNKLFRPQTHFGFDKEGSEIATFRIVWKVESYGKVHLRSSLKNEGETSIVDKWLLGLFYMSHILQIIVVEVTSGEFDLPKSCHVSIPSKKSIIKENVAFRIRRGGRSQKHVTIYFCQIARSVCNQVWKIVLSRKKLCHRKREAKIGEKEKFLQNTTMMFNKNDEENDKCGQPSWAACHQIFLESVVKILVSLNHIPNQSK